MTTEHPVQSVRAALVWARAQLDASASPALDAEVLLAHVMQQSRTYLHTWPERTLSSAEHAHFLELTRARAAGTPIAHLLGSREFWSLELLVNDSTLIPRPDTEVLVEKILQLGLPEGARVLDLGTGTGAIALALKSEHPDWQLTAVDQSAAAVELAKTNAERLQLECEILQSDWFSALAATPAADFDCIVANPPYIAADDPHLQQGDVRFEPVTALVASDNGFADLQHIITTARRYLKAGGWLVLEHGWQQAAGCRELLQAAGYEAVASGTDYANLERMSFGQWCDASKVTSEKGGS
ncbi:peptide chain release factor N(5)-glutamine methyltransferase [Pseudidiomarina sp. 1APP75-27a]|uniref:peptide chain release factor N(5)-glutamine methyltransferase n=1 Tax=Pseudidiomarina terrestris TaxID=2820060 RepID=UPI00264F54BF|nr:MULTISPECIES: peptide chain release factor N(5)-glutamine methyltransferase [unclassified Pseudidiomarina]MDN7127800.1 peptide chain release factor N(5)-glutamine methyltransferase [Pseudidiomarina sp. 1APR75-33.1]MDN7137508.1 peptide chain release factor N(5)-glutamine methyltransferase [Pseudidiomarina sp. 1ASP75-14]MEA3587382.1 peptide chain release factor N(5)-glutamine methyltransferase [Pseudidiomarina sp. 1APP75-27a]